MLKKISLIIVSVMMPLLAVSLTSSVSPWEHSNAELSISPTVIPGTAPIEYTSVFTREREMFGYKPRFMPGVVTFDKNNRPYILTAVHSTNKYDGNQSAYQNTFETQVGYIQTINNEGNWIAYDLAQMYRAMYNISHYEPVRINSGFNRHDRVIFDYYNNVYFSFYQANGFSGKTITYSVDGLQSVKRLGLAYNYMAAFEVFDTFSSVERDLPTLSYTPSSSPMLLTELNRDALGDLLYSSNIEVSTIDGQSSGGHTGYLNTTITVGDTIHCVWLDSQDQTDEYYTRQYHSSYNRRTGEVSGPHYLGSTYGYWPEGGNPADTHNGPTITVDRDKVLHVVLGGHGSQAKYTYSTDQGRTWAAPIDLPGENSVSTYPAVITDRENSVHLVQRATTDSYGLGYSRKKNGQAWDAMGALIIPGRSGYSIFNHKMTVDRLGRLFLSYWYRAANLSTEEQAEYDAKWPGQDDELSHDPVILMSNDGGDTWKIATTADFVAGIIDDTIPVAVYNFDRSGNLGLDMAGFDNNLGSVGSPVAVSSIYGGGVSFNGTTDGLAGSLNQAQAFTDGSFTVVGWFKPDAAVSGLSNLVNAKTGDSGFALSVNSGQWIGYTYADGYTHSVVASADITVGQWKHIAFTYKADGEAEAGTYTGTSKLYVDGSLIATQTGRKYAPQDATDIAIAMDTAGANFFACSADEIGIFKGAMPEQKIVELADNTFRPQNVSRELLYQGDINGDGIVDIDDLMVITDNWLATE